MVYVSKADEMFEDLGYKKVHDNKFQIVYRKNESFLDESFLDEDFDFRIVFAKIPKFVFSENEQGGAVGLEARVLQAINEKVKELGWLDEEFTRA